ncbi:MAG: NapC/NirT family cytochrome c [Gammaproteobacteria bacterium]|nr:NapC/NirT family cytochrome c [Gammaproteobacteria bacterium]
MTTTSNQHRRRCDGFVTMATLLLFLLGGLAGIIFWGGFNTVLELTNKMEFCISCHEMHDNVYQEYKETVHFKNASGVQATCADCHVPRPWVHKVVRKIQASKEVFHWALGSYDTPEKFDAHRWTMANRVWDSMKQTDSRECRNCHDFSNMDLSEQDRYARKRHSRAIDEGKTCIDCHQGIAHKMPREPEEEAEVAQAEPSK